MTNGKCADLPPLPNAILTITSIGFCSVLYEITRIVYFVKILLISWKPSSAPGALDGARTPSATERKTRYYPTILQPYYPSTLLSFNPTILLPYFASPRGTKTMSLVTLCSESTYICSVSILTPNARSPIVRLTMKVDTTIITSFARCVRD